MNFSGVAKLTNKFWGSKASSNCWLEISKIGAGQTRTSLTGFFGSNLDINRLKTITQDTLSFGGKKVDVLTRASHITGGQKHLGEAFQNGIYDVSSRVYLPNGTATFVAEMSPTRITQGCRGTLSMPGRQPISVDYKNGTLKAYTQLEGREIPLNTLEEKIVRTALSKDMILMG